MTQTRKNLRVYHRRKKNAYTFRVFDVAQFEVSVRDLWLNETSRNNVTKSYKKLVKKKKKSTTFQLPRKFISEGSVAAE